MFQVESNAESVFVNFLRDVEITEIELPDTLRRAAVDSVAIIAHRIQQLGKSASGKQLQTKAKLSKGAYSKAYAEKRAERGRQINQVDLTNDGDLMRDFQVIAVSPRLVTAGFLHDKQADKADCLEAYYGEEIFGLSDQEQEFVSEGLAQNVIDNFE